MKKIVAIILSLVMVFTVMAEPASAVWSMLGVVPYVAGANPEHTDAMHFLIRHWHTEKGALKDIDPIIRKDNDSLVIEGYIEPDGSGYKFYDKDWKVITDNVADYYKLDAANGSIEFYANPYVIGDSATEEFAGFSVSAGHSAAEAGKVNGKETLTITYNKDNNDVHLVKSHVFYRVKGIKVAGTNDSTVFGSDDKASMDDHDVGFVYTYAEDGATYKAGDFVKTDNGQHMTSLPKSGYFDVDGEGEPEEDDILVKKVKVYSTTEGLHTDKTAKVTEREELLENGKSDGRTFDIDLESWFIGQNFAYVGMILDASGSMAFTSEKLKPVTLDEKQLADLRGDGEGQLGKSVIEGSTKPNGSTLGDWEEFFITADELKSLNILDPRNTDNGLLSYSGYSYFVFDDRDTTNEYVPIAYWDGGSVEKTEGKTETLEFPGENSLERYYAINKDPSSGTSVRAWLLDSWNNSKDALMVERQSVSEEFSFGNDKQVSNAENWSTYKGIQMDGTYGYGITKTTRVLRGATDDAPRGMMLGYHPVNGTFTLSFDIILGTAPANFVNGTEPPQNIAEILYIGTEKPNGDNYFRVVRGAGDNANKLIGYQGNTTKEISSANGVFTKGAGNTRYHITYVFNNGKVLTYVNGKLDPTYKNQVVNFDSGEINIIFGAFNDEYDGQYIFVDNIYVYSTALTSNDVLRLHNSYQTVVDDSPSKVPWDIPGSSITKSGGQNIAKDSAGNILAAIDNVDSGKGWYYISSAGNWRNNYSHPQLGTGKNFVSVNEAADANNNNNKTFSYNGAEYIHDGANEPILFFVSFNEETEEYELCCFFSSGGNRKQSSKVYLNPDTSYIKAESLQRAIGSFATELSHYSPDSHISAVRFSAPILNSNSSVGAIKNNGIPRDQLDTLVLLDWTNDSAETAGILSLTRGDGTGTYTTSKNGAKQYNYGMTGGTYTYAGLTAFNDYLADSADPNAKKYIILFTDGKDDLLDDKTNGNLAPDMVDTLKEKGYTVFTVMLAGGSISANSEDEAIRKKYRDAKIFLQGLSGDKDTFPGDRGNYYYEANTVDALTKLFTEKILAKIVDNLSQYTVQDYIDPRFNLVDANGDVWKLEANGRIIVSNGKSHDLSDGHSTKITLSNDAEVDASAREAQLHYDSKNNMYYLVWENQTIPGSNSTSTQIPVWNARITVQAKEDFIGGNAILTNGNSADMNYVYQQDDPNASSGMDKMLRDEENNPNPSKGFPRTTVNVEVPDLSIVGGEQLIYMGEELTAKDVAEELGKTIEDYLAQNNDDVTSWYWEYLERYAVYEGYYVDSDGHVQHEKGHVSTPEEALKAIIQSIVEAADEEGSAKFKYYYIPEAGLNPTTQTGSADHHEKDVFGYLVFTWNNVVETEGGNEYPEDGITTDTKKRVSSLKVEYVPLPSKSEIDGDETREGTINDNLIHDENDYKWDADFKPAAGEEQKDPLDDTGTFTTNIVKGEIVLEMKLKTEDLKYLYAHGYGGNGYNLVYVANIERNGKVVGTLTATYSNWSNLANETKEYITVQAVIAYTGTDLDTEYPVGLPNGTYKLVKNTEKTVELGPFKFDDIKILTISNDDASKFDVYDVGNLAIEAIADEETNTEPFVFTVTLDDDTVNGTFSGVEFIKGEATVEVNAGEKVIIEGLPAGVGYTVTTTSTAFKKNIGTKGIIPCRVTATAVFSTDENADLTGFADETNKDFKHYEAYVDGDSIILGYEPAAGVPEKPYTDYRFGLTQVTGELELGSVTIKKNVTNLPNGEVHEEFKFTVTLTDENGNPLVGSYPTDRKDDNNKVITISSGETITLYTGESLTISELPAGALVTIKEITEDANGDYIYNFNYDTSYTAVNSKGTTIANVNAKSYVATVVKDDTITVTFNNDVKLGNLTLAKEVTNAPSSVNDTFTFIITLTDQKDNLLKGSYKYYYYSNNKRFEKNLAKYEEEGEEVDGKYTLTLKAGEIAEIIGLPDGAKYVIEEVKSDGFKYDVVYDSDDKSVDKIEGVIEKVEDKSETVENEYMTGELTISKEVEGEDADTNKDFIFTIKFEAPEGVTLDTAYKYVGGTIEVEGANNAPADDEVVLTNNRTTATITLKHGQSITIKGLPAGTTFTVTENEANKNGYTTTATVTVDGATTDVTADGVIANGTIAYDTDNNAPKNITVAYCNELKKGALTVTKTVKGLNGTEPDGFYAEDEFTFKFTFTDDNGKILTDEYDYAITPVPSGDNEADYKGKIKSGGTVTLSNGQSVEIKGLPAGTKYTVVETPDGNYGVSYDDNCNGVMPVDGNGATVNVTNTRKSGYVNIRKLLTAETGAEIDENDSKIPFTITLEITGTDGKPLTGDYKYSLDDGATSQSLAKATDPNDDTVTVAGKYILTIYKDQIAKILDLPVGAKVLITETDIPGGYEFRSTTVQTSSIIASYAINETGTETVEVTVEAGDNGLITYNNIKKKTGLSISKTVVADNDAFVDGDQEFEFTVTLTLPTTPAGLTLGETYKVTGISGQTEVEIENNSFSVTLKHGQTVTVIGLPYGTTYEVAETELSNYVLLTEDNADEYDGSVYSTGLEGEVGTDNAVVYNLFKVAPVIVTPTATKNIEGRELVDGEFEFTMTISTTDGEFTYGNDEKLTTATDTATNGKDANNNYTGEVTFGEITFTKPGTYTVTITEVTEEDGTNGITYDRHELVYTYVVEAEDGKLVIKHDDPEAADNDPTSVSGDTTFENSYSAEPVNITPEIEKILNGRTLNADEFGFTIEITSDGGKFSYKGGTAGNAKVTDDTAKNGADGKVTFGEISFTEVGTYTVTISENAGTDGVNGIYYDDRDPIVLTYVIKDDGEGNLYIVEADSTTLENVDATFTNEYKASADVAPVVKKSYVNYDGTARSLKGVEFKFELKLLSGEMSGVTLNDVAFTAATTVEAVKAEDVADGTVTFENMKFVKPGTYTFEIKEIIPDTPDVHITYDRAAITVTYVVTDENSDGTLTVSQPAYGSYGDTFRNIYSEGSLKITKVVEGEGGETDRDFNFTVKLTDKSGNVLTDSYRYIKADEDGNEIGRGEIGNNGNVTLKHGQSVTIGGLPVGAKYEVEELEENQDGYSTTYTDEKGTIGSDGLASATIVNTKNIRTLTITKIVAGPNMVESDYSKEFKFKVTLIGEVNPNDEFAATGDAPEIVDGKIRLDSDAATVTVTLKHNESITIKGLPAGTVYSVEETEESRKGYTTVSTGENGTLPESGDMQAVFVNTKGYGNLTVTKVVAGNDVDLNKAFGFKVALSDTTVNGEYGEMEFTNGVAEFSLKHFESATATGLPYGITFTVTETDYTGEGYSTSFTGDSAAGDVTATATADGRGMTGTIPLDGGASVVFLNTKYIKTGDLTITKTVVSDEETDKQTPFGFLVNFYDNNGAPLDAETTFNFKGYSNGEITQSGEVANGGTVWVMHGEMIIIENLPENTSYLVTELYNPNVYTSVSSGDNGTILAGGRSDAVFVNIKREHPVGALEITKNVDGIIVDPNETFEFLVTLSDTTVNGKHGDIEFTNGVATVYLRAGESAYADDLPAGISYTVTETAKDGYVSQSSNAFGGIPADDVATVNFVNSSTVVGSLVVTKTVIGSESDKQIQFTFTVELNNPEINGLYGNMDFTDGVAYVTLMHGESAYAAGLPEGTTFTVTETSVPGFATRANGIEGVIAGGIITQGEVASANFVNEDIESVGNLTVTKTVVGDPDYDGTPFDITVTIVGAIIPDGWYGDMYFEGNAATLHLANGDSVTATNLPTGATYIVSEPNSGGYDVSVSCINPGEGNVIVKDKTAYALVTNTLPATEQPKGTLTIVKAVAGNDANENEQFTFTIELKNPDGSAHGGKYNTVLETINDGTIDGELIFDAEGKATYDLRHGDKLTVFGLPSRTRYTVTENSKDYTSVSIGDEGSINDVIPAVAVFVNSKFKEVGSLTVAKVVKNGNNVGTDLTVKTGDTVTYSIIVKNTGGAAVQNVVITDEVRAELTVIEDSISNGGVLANGVITWTINEIASGETVTVSFNAIVPDEEGSWDNIAKVKYNDPSDPEGDPKEETSDSATVKSEKTDTPPTTPKPSIVITKTAANGGNVGTQLTVKTGDTVTYSITVKNTGNAAAKNVVITDEVNAGLTVIEDSISNGGVLANGVITWTINEIASGETVTVSFNAIVPDEEGSWDNIAKIKYNDPSDPEGAPKKETSDPATVKSEQTDTPNEYGSLAITKYVLSGEYYREFSFRVILTDENGNDIAGSFSYDGSKSGTIVSGGIITLKNGESITISGIPLGTRYVVTELTPANYTVSSYDSMGKITRADVIYQAVFFNNIRTSGGGITPPPVGGTTPTPTPPEDNDDLPVIEVPNATEGTEFAEVSESVSSDNGIAYLGFIGAAFAVAAAALLMKKKKEH